MSSARSVAEKAALLLTKYATPAMQPKPSGLISSPTRSPLAPTDFNIEFDSDGEPIPIERIVRGSNASTNQVRSGDDVSFSETEIEFSEASDDCTDGAHRTANATANARTDDIDDVEIITATTTASECEYADDFSEAEPACNDDRISVDIQTTAQSSTLTAPEETEQTPPQTQPTPQPEPKPQTRLEVQPQPSLPAPVWTPSLVSHTNAQEPAPRPVPVSAPAPALERVSSCVRTVSPLSFDDLTSAVAAAVAQRIADDMRSDISLMKERAEVADVTADKSLRSSNFSYRFKRTRQRRQRRLRSRRNDDAESETDSDNDDDVIPSTLQHVATQTEPNIDNSTPNANKSTNAHFWPPITQNSFSASAPLPSASLVASAAASAAYGAVSAAMQMRLFEPTTPPPLRAQSFRSFADNQHAHSTTQDVPHAPFSHPPTTQYSSTAPLSASITAWRTANSSTSTLSSTSVVSSSLPSDSSTTCASARTSTSTMAQANANFRLQLRNLRSELASFRRSFDSTNSSALANVIIRV